MRKANCNVSRLLENRLADANMSEHDRNRALSVMRDAEAIVNAIVWAKDRVASFGALFLRPGLKN